MASPTRPAAELPPEAAAESSRPDFVLEEGPGGWTLTIALGDRLLDALAGYADGEVPPSGFTVDVRPNLVPGGPFPTSVVIKRPHTV